MLGPNARPKNRHTRRKNEICPKISSVNDAKSRKISKIETCAKSKNRQKSKKTIKIRQKIGKAEKRLRSKTKISKKFFVKFLRNFPLYKTAQQKRPILKKSALSPSEDEGWVHYRKDDFSLSEKYVKNRRFFGAKIRSVYPYKLGRE